MLLAALTGRAAALVRPGRRVVLGVAGTPGAGKSTFAAALVERLNAGPPPAVVTADRELGEGRWAALLPMDGFHHPQARLVTMGVRDRMGAPETFDAAAYAHTIERVTEDEETVLAPAFDRAAEAPRPGGLRIERGHRLVVTEGNYLLLPHEPWCLARRRMAEVWYVQVDEPLRLQRLVARHVRFGKSQRAAADWVARVDQANARLVEKSASTADLVIPLR